MFVIEDRVLGHGKEDVDLTLVFLAAELWRERLLRVEVQGSSVRGDNTFDRANVRFNLNRAG